MKTIKFENKEEAEKFSNVIASIKIANDLLNQDRKLLQTFQAANVEAAKFWMRYANERTHDAKLREIAAAELETAENQDVCDFDIPAKILGDLLTYFSELSIEY